LIDEPPFRRMVGGETPRTAAAPHKIHPTHRGIEAVVLLQTVSIVPQRTAER
jgi:hypothetical protein